MQTLMAKHAGCSGHARTDGRTARRGIRRPVPAGLKDWLMAPEAPPEAIRAYAEETGRFHRERLSAVPADLPDIHPNVAEIGRRKVGRLAEAPNRPENRGEAVSAIRGLIERIALVPGEKWGEVHTTPHDDPAAVLGWTAKGDGKNRGGSSLPGMSVSAETRTRFGLDCRHA